MHVCVYACISVCASMCVYLYDMCLCGVYTFLFVSVCLFVSLCVTVCVCLSYDVANGSTPVPNYVVQTRWGQGSLTWVLQANNRDSSCIQIIQCVRRFLYLDQVF